MLWRTPCFEWQKANYGVIDATHICHYFRLAGRGSNPGRAEARPFVLRVSSQVAEIFGKSLKPAYSSNSHADP
jgi:hypothetical protein